MSFEDYLTQKKIDSQAFRKAEPQRWSEFNLLFDQMHPNSFTTQKKFLINDLRRLYLLKEIPKQPEPAVPETGTAPLADAPKPAKPAIKRAAIVRKPPATES
jgi:hypothetical protein